MNGQFFRKTLCLFPLCLFLIFSASAQDSNYIPLADTTEYHDEDYDAFDTYDYDSINLPSDHKTAPSHYIIDNAKLLSNTELSNLENRAREIGEIYHFGVHIISINNYTSFGSTIEDAAEELYSKLNLGYGDQNSGISLVLSMEDRSFDLDAFGYGNDVFTDYGKELLTDTFLDDFAENNWYEGFSDYINEAKVYLKAAESGNPIDYYEPEREPASVKSILKDLYGYFGLAAIIAAVLAFMALSKEKNRMKSVAAATQANAYISGAVQLDAKQDSFTHKTTHTVRIQTPTQTRSSGGGGGTTVRPSGHSHHSGHF
ncbi:MAG: TPM domain-containing protein [Treponema sp.]|nr:TPM domain-containing protein [Treponema sp.]